MPRNPFLDPGEVNAGQAPVIPPPPQAPPGGDQTDNQGGDTQGGNTFPGGVTNWDDFYNQLQNDPMYKQALSFIDYARQMEKTQMAGNKQRATDKYNEALRRIGISREDALRQVMNDLAARHALESGDTKFYRGKVEEQAANAKWDAQMSLKDYMAGVEAAYQNDEFNRMMQQYNAMQNAAQFEYNIWSQLGGFPGSSGSSAPVGGTGQ